MLRGRDDWWMVRWGGRTRGDVQHQSGDDFSVKRPRKNDDEFEATETW